ncbi:MAG: hypothetical protein AB2L14_19495 [Candidatus Xenobiia bacterium LiM19]
MVRKTDMKKELIMLINRIPEYQIASVKTLLESLLECLEKQEKEMKSRAILAYMESVPEEDYEMSEEEKASILRGEKDIIAGRFHKWEDVAEELEI